MVDTLSVGSKNMAGTLYYLEFRGERAGPYRSSELKRLAIAGAISPDALVRRVGSRIAVPASRVSGLFRTTDLEFEPKTDDLNEPNDVD